MSESSSRIAYSRISYKMAYASISCPRNPFSQYQVTPMISPGRFLSSHIFFNASIHMDLHVDEITNLDHVISTMERSHLTHRSSKTCPYSSIQESRSILLNRENDRRPSNELSTPSKSKNITFSMVLNVIC